MPKFTASNQQQINICTAKQFFDAVRTGKSELVESLNYLDTYLNMQIGDSHNPHAFEKPDYTALHMAVRTGYGLEKSFLAKNGDPVGLLTYLLNNGSDPNGQTMQGDTPLHLTNGVESFELAKQLIGALITAQADINKKNTEGNTPLHESLSNAAYIGSGDPVNLTNLLISKGARVNEINNKGEAPLHIVADRGKGDKSNHFFIIQSLLKAGADSNLKNSNGKTPLHLICLHSKYEQDVLVKMADLLLLSSADVNVKDNDGNTPLHLAVGAENTELVQLLINNGANPTMTNNSGKKPAQMSPFKPPVQFGYGTYQINYKFLDLCSMLQKFEMDYILDSAKREKEIPHNRINQELLTENNQLKKQIEELKSKISELEAHIKQYGYKPATKIQATFRGFLARKESKQLKEERILFIKEKMPETLAKLAREERYHDAKRLVQTFLDNRLHEAVQIIQGITEREIQINQGSDNNNNITVKY
jgi:ankyrin repeat protein